MTLVMLFVNIFRICAEQVKEKLQNDYLVCLKFNIKDKWPIRNENGRNGCSDDCRSITHTCIVTRIIN